LYMACIWFHCYQTDHYLQVTVSKNTTPYKEGACRRPWFPLTAGNPYRVEKESNNE